MGSNSATSGGEVENCTSSFDTQSSMTSPVMTTAHTMSSTLEQATSNTLITVNSAHDAFGNYTSSFYSSPDSSKSQLSSSASRLSSNSNDGSSEDVVSNIWKNTGNYDIWKSGICMFNKPTPSYHDMNVTATNARSVTNINSPKRLPQTEGMAIPATQYPPPGFTNNNIINANQQNGFPRVQVNNGTTAAAVSKMWGPQYQPHQNKQQLLPNGVSMDNFYRFPSQVPPPQLLTTQPYLHQFPFSYPHQQAHPMFCQQQQQQQQQQSPALPIFSFPTRLSRMSSSPGSQIRQNQASLSNSHAVSQAFIDSTAGMASSPSSSSASSGSLSVAVGSSSDVWRHVEVATTSSGTCVTTSGCEMNSHVVGRHINSRIQRGHQPVGSTSSPISLNQFISPHQSIIGSAMSSSASHHSIWSPRAMMNTSGSSIDDENQATVGEDLLGLRNIWDMPDNSS